MPLPLLPLVGKTRRPKFELHLKIYDLNNVPLVSGNSYIKWHLSHSMHAEHRGRTNKCAIANHRVDFSFSKLVPSIRISVDKNNNLSECPIEFEILQEFAVSEKITLGSVKLNLSEYVTESELQSKDSPDSPKKHGLIHGVSLGHGNHHLGHSSAPKSSQNAKHDEVEDGIVRRYLMQDSKVNSTLKVGILMVQIEGERNFIAPPLKIVPVFGGISGLMAPDQAEDEMGSLPNISKSRDASEVHDLYRRTLAAFWFSQPNEVPADECIEDIFSGGNGWKTRREMTSTDSEEEETEENSGTLRPSDLRRLAERFHSSRTSNHRRANSGSSEKSVSTVTGSARAAAAAAARLSPHVDEGRDPRGARDLARDRSRDRSGSLRSLTPTLGSDRGRADVTYKSAREVPEAEVRDDLVAWRLPGVLSTHGEE